MKKLNAEISKILAKNKLNGAAKAQVLQDLNAKMLAEYYSEKVKKRN